METPLPRVVVKSAQYDSSCNKLKQGDTITFGLNVDFPDQSVREVSDFEIQMVPKKGDKIETATCKMMDTYSKVLTCELEFKNEIEDNIYYPFLKKKVVGDEYQITPFNLVDYGLGTTLFDVIRPTDKQYKFNVYYDYSQTKYDLAFQFESELSEETKSGNNELSQKAANLFLQKYAPNGYTVYIYIDKNIPVNAGLGGGSSDAGTGIKILLDFFIWSC